MHRAFSAVPSLVIASLLAAGVPGTSIDRVSADESVFEKPVRLQADGKIIDTGKAWGHSGPCLADVDGDGLRDLVVGDFSGKFHVYRNAGTNQQPKFGPPTVLIAGGVPAQVPIYCCIGSSPQFFDFDGDGHSDLISGSYDPGACYLFRGLGNGRFAARETIVDKAGNVILRNAHLEVTRSFGSWPTMVDWNGDGRLDLVIGSFEGGIRVWLNEGTAQRPKFAVDGFSVQAGGKPIAVPGGHAAPVIVDWDGDGRWDILSGCEKGAVIWYRNTGKLGEPYFANGQTLVPEHRGSGYEEFLEIGAEPVPGIRSQIAAADFDGDGRIDLLLGDFCTTVSPRPDLTPAQRLEMYKTLERKRETSAQLRQQLDEQLQEIRRRYPGDKLHSRAADEEWSKMYKAMRDSKQREELESRAKQLDGAVAAYLAKPERRGSTPHLDTVHGYVWLFRRKPFVPASAPVEAASDMQPIKGRESDEGPTRSNPVVATAAVLPRRVRAGESLTLTVDLRVAAGWHINAVSSGSGTAIPTRLELNVPPGISVAADWTLPEPDVGGPETGPVYRGQVTFRRTLKVAEKAAVGRVELSCDFAYQACDDNQCLRPTKVSLKAPLEVVPQ
ncbi:MAG TPA: FG-GAP-like repeat-containing protein [Planctomycetaceae bacterium]|jgi:hypothetical protein|nr:FG-GAP-like repeat-containing protein [Planctomycetaceae bacterium]